MLGSLNLSKLCAVGIDVLFSALAVGTVVRMHGSVGGAGAAAVFSLVEELKMSFNRMSMMFDFASNKVAEWAQLEGFLSDDLQVLQ